MNELSEARNRELVVGCLEPKQKLYVQARAQGALPVPAAVQAGYADPEAKAQELERSLVVRTALEYELRVMSRALETTRQDVIEGIKDGIRLASDGMTVIAGWREIGRILGVYAPQKVNVDHNVRVTREKLAAMTDEEISELAAIDAEFVVLRDDPHEAPDS